MMDSYSIDTSDTLSSEASELFDYVVEKCESILNKELVAIDHRYPSNFLYYMNQGGRNFLFDPIKTLQPRSFQVLEKLASNYKIGFRWSSIIPAPHMPKTNFTAYSFFEVKGRLIFVCNPVWSEKPYGGEDTHDALPDILKETWLKRGAGWGTGRLPLAYSDYRQLIGNYVNWQPIESILFSFDRSWPKSKMMEMIKSKVPNVYVTHYNPHDGSPSEWCSMRCFLDTRPYGLDGKCGDQFFVIDSRTDKVVYHIHDGDVANLRILEPDAVGEAMDEYCAHTLLRTEGRFDFLPYSRLL